MSLNPISSQSLTVIFIYIYIFIYFYLGSSSLQNNDKISLPVCRALISLKNHSSDSHSNHVPPIHVVSPRRGFSLFYPPRPDLREGVEDVECRAL